MRGPGILTLNSAMVIADGHWVSALFCRRWVIATDAMVGTIMGVAFHSAERWSIVGLFDDAPEMVGLGGESVIATEHISVMIPGCRVNAFMRAERPPSTVPNVGVRP